MPPTRVNEEVTHDNLAGGDTKLCSVDLRERVMAAEVSRRAAAQRFEVGVQGDQVV